MNRESLRVRNQSSAFNVLVQGIDGKKSLTLPSQYCYVKTEQIPKIEYTQSKKPGKASGASSFLRRFLYLGSLLP